MTENLPQTQNNIMPSPQEFQMLQVIAKNAQDSGLYGGVGQQSKIFMVLLAARELGVSPMLALNGGIWNIQGKIEISARLMNGLIRRAGHSITIVRSDDEACILKGTRKDGDSFEVSFTKQDAEKAGLWGNNTWKKYPGDMLYNRCMSRLARRLFSDVIGNSYVEGEIRESKEVDRLEQAECEDLTQNQIKKTTENVINSHITTLNQENKETVSLEPKITFDQLSEIMIGYAKTNDTFKENYEKYMREKWNVTEFEDLPEKAYQPTITAIQRNIESQVTAVKNENN